MDEDGELSKRLGRDWEKVYTERDVTDLPWHREKPDAEFIALLESGELSPRRVLDVGCGAGTDAIFLARRGCKVTGLDISSEAIGIARKRAKEVGADVEFVAVDYLKTPFDPGAFDFVNDRGCFHHMEPAGRPEFVVKAHRDLDDGGRYLLRCWSDKQAEQIRVTIKNSEPPRNGGGRGEEGWRRSPSPRICGAGLQTTTKILNTQSNRQDDVGRGPFSLSMDDIIKAFSGHFALGDIVEFRFGGDGANGYLCLMTKK